MFNKLVNINKDINYKNIKSLKAVSLLLTLNISYTLC